MLDEIEKAHPDIFNILLQIMDDGVLCDAMGRKTHFSNCIIIMTSNLTVARSATQKRLGFFEGADEITASDLRGDKQLTEFFKPEFLNRIDEIVLFSSLGHDELKKICTIMLEDLSKRANAAGISLDISESVSDIISARCLSEHRSMGARPLQREIADSIENPLSSLILRQASQNYVVTEQNGKITVEAR